MSENSADALKAEDLIPRLPFPCRGLTANVLANWARPKAKALVEGTDFFKKPGANYYYLRAIPRIHRLYHYDRERHLENYKQYVDGYGKQAFYVFFDRHPSLVPSQALHLLVRKTFIEVALESHGIFDLIQVCSVYGGQTNSIMMCQCVDAEDLSNYINKGIEKLRNSDTSALPRWGRAADETYFSPRSQEDKVMRAIVVVSAANQNSGGRLKDIFESLKDVQGVRAMSLVYGDAEMIVTVDARDEVELKEIVVDRLRDEKGVTGTKTYIVIHGYDYDRYPSDAKEDQEHTPTESRLITSSEGSKR